MSWPDWRPVAAVGNSGGGTAPGEMPAEVTVFSATAAAGEHYRGRHWAAGTGQTLGTEFGGALTRLATGAA